MSHPRFSLLIPTRNRLATLRHSLETALAQTGDDFEVVVMDNACSDGTAEFLSNTRHPRLRHVRTESALSMSNNWEQGLAQCRGEYISVIGDDDGFMPEAVRFAGAVIDATRAELVMWQPHNYWWPDTIVEHERNTLYVTVDVSNGLVRHASKHLLEKYYDFEVGYDVLPQIYNSFVSRRVIDRVIKETGKYFHTEAPDLFSGIANCHYTEDFVKTSRPLSLRGISGQSNGAAYYMRSRGAEIRERYLSEVGLTLRDVVHEDYLATPNLEFYVASINHMSKQILFPQNERLAINPTVVVQYALANLGRDPDSYDEVLREITAFCALRGVDMGGFKVPPRPSGARVRALGPQRNAKGSVAALAVRGDLLGISTIADAARVASALTGSPR